MPNGNEKSTGNGKSKRQPNALAKPMGDPYEALLKGDISFEPHIPRGGGDTGMTYRRFVKAIVDEYLENRLRGMKSEKAA